MRQSHKAWEKCFVDFSGKRPSYENPSIGETVEVEFFVAVLGASNCDLPGFFGPVVS